MCKWIQRSWWVGVGLESISALYLSYLQQVVIFGDRRFLNLMIQDFLPLIYQTADFAYVFYT